ncbi:hypothetical protein [Clostridium sp. Marseille-Q7071]
MGLQQKNPITKHVDEDDKKDAPIQGDLGCSRDLRYHIPKMGTR